jgi:hypothetical protein
MEREIKLPVFWPWYLILAVSFVVEIFADLKVSPGGLICLIYWLSCVHQIHAALSGISNGRYPIKPGKAVWYHFIPVFNLYWVFKWTKEMENFVNARLRSSEGMNGIASGIFLLIGFCVGKVLGGVFGMAILLGVLVYIKSKIKTVLGVTLLSEEKQPEKSQLYYF